MSGWGNFPRVEAQVLEPSDRVGVQAYLLGRERLIARGNGRSYGDASLSPVMVSTLRLNRVLHFDETAGTLECEAGVLLADLLTIIVPTGWFFQVTPGTKHITVGGAIASDVHGKNHPQAGCFSNSLIFFELMTASGEIKRCSRSENAPLFWQTCGGMGWTGIVLSAKFALQKMASPFLMQKTVRAQNVQGLFQAFQEHPHWSYGAAWVDCSHKHWRGAAFFAEHSNIKTNRPEAFLERPSRNVPFYAPGGMLNSLSIWAYNSLYFHRNREGERLIGWDQYFYPLDSLRHWNRLYGRRGFVQYQFCLPENTAFDGMLQQLQTIRKSRETPFLSVLKRHGERPPEALHSFPIRGYSLALDFPRTPGLLPLLQRLDEQVWALGGKIYLSKDACSAARMGRIDPATFGEERFWSFLKGRILAG